MGWLVVVATALIVVAACAPPPPPPVDADTTQRPVVLLDGWQLDCHISGAGVWRTWSREASVRQGASADVSVFAYDACRPNAETIDAFGRFVDGVLSRTGATEVDVVAHSMGSLIVRSCIRFGTCDDKVDKFLSLAGANHGTVWAGVCRLAFWSLSTCDMEPDGPFLDRLNRDDETWGDTEYVTMISACDLTIVPFTSAALDGALNIVSDRCVGHTDWLSDAVAARWTFDWFGGGSVSPPPPAPPGG